MTRPGTIKLPTDAAQGTRVYLAGSLGPLTPPGSENPWLHVTAYERVDGKWREQRPAPEVSRAEKPVAAAAVVVQSAHEACESVLARAGAKVRDADDLRVIREVREQSRKGYPPTDDRPAEGLRARA